MTHTCDNGTVTVQWRDGVATITLDGDTPVNAIDLPMAEDLREAVERVEAGGARAAVVRGAGDTYCAGGDLSQDAETFLEAVDVSLDAVVRVFESGTPYVAAIDGAAIGGGLELALACDLRVAAEDATLALPEAGLGIIPPAGAIRFLAHLVGTGRARDLLLTGRRITGREAEAWGLVSRTTTDDPDEVARSLAADVAARSAPAVEAILKSLNEAHSRPVSSAKWDLELAKPLARSEAFDRGKAAVLDGDRHDFSETE